jgi:hypothetical protein
MIIIVSSSLWPFSPPQSFNIVQLRRRHYNCLKTLNLLDLVATVTKCVCLLLALIQTLFKMQW